MNEISFRQIIKNGLWNNNPALVQLLGLCPLLAVSASVVNALGLGIATTVVMVGSNTAVSIIRNHVDDAVRLPAFVMIIASFTTAAELLMQAFTYELYHILGIFIPLIVTNCNILGRADGFARKHGVIPSLLDGLMMGLGFMLVLVLLGAIREIIGQGIIFSNMQLLFGPVAKDWQITVFSNYPQFLFAILPPGAFVALGLIIAAKNAMDGWLKARQQPANQKTGSKRVRVTGTIS
ncbi:electron transport complex subunit E [Gynuella sunshinyii]|uniref:Ion-translocating oxidoreductase complex subunit E n=1 Tax=Gynuella sunshinyii YC6258 TaxID=1445510 RepID=A0A0C5VZQ3_9GAMM|nr:electron transport complex subunit E [Gynuella sunshinyii]AJQ95909.1 putative NADH:ubiquinone oxidoreductase, subunit RnfE [Gynuella sunshinyii YC6258]